MSRAGKWLLACVPFSVFAVFLASPLVCIAVQSHGEVLSLFSDTGFATALRHSLVVSGLASALTLLIAFLLAYTVHNTRLPTRGKAAVSALICLPMLLPTVTYGFAILYSFGKHGLVTNLLGLHLDLYGMRGLIVGYIIYTLPTAYILLNNSMDYIDQRFFIVSQLMGDRALRRFWSTQLRPLLSTMGAAFVQSFFLCFTDYGIPMSIGGRYEVVSIRLYQYMLGALPDFQKGAAAAVIMLLPTLASLILLRWLHRLDFRYDHIERIPMPKRPVHDAVCIVLSGGVLLCLCSVFAVLFIVPFVHSWPYAPYFSLEHVRALFTTPRLLQVYRNSLVIAGATALLGTGLAYLSALLNGRMKLPAPARWMIDTCAALANTVPGMVLGIGLMFAFSGTALQYTFCLIIFCNIVHFFHTPYAMAVQSLSKLSDRWETVAALMGDSWGKTLIRVVIPNTATTVFEMFSYYFINSMVTISAVVFLAGAHTMVITTRIKELQCFSRYDEILTLSLLVLATNALVKLLTYAVKKAAHKTGAKTRVFGRALAVCAAAVFLLSPVVLEGAKDNKIIVYSNADEDVVRIMSDVLDQHGFRDSYILQSFGTSELGGKLLVEQQNIEADVVTISDYYLTSAQARGMSFVNPGYRPALASQNSDIAAPLVGNTACVIVNDAALDAAGLPRPDSLRDLADPCYQGQISIPSIQGSSTGWLLVQAIVNEYGEDEGRTILAGLIRNAGPHVEMSGSGPLTKLTSGEVAVAYGIRYQAERAARKGMPITCLPLDSCYTMTESVAVIEKPGKEQTTAQEIALCLQKYARPLIREQHPSALYPGEPEDGQANSYPDPLTAELLLEHQELFRTCMGDNGRS